jgi:hypothetical protein
VPEFRGYHLRDSEATLSRQPLSESLLRHFHGHIASLIVAGSEPTFIGGLPRGFQHLSDDQSFELRGCLRDLIGLRNRLAERLMKGSLGRLVLSDLLRIYAGGSHRYSGQKMNVHEIGLNHFELRLQRARAAETLQDRDNVPRRGADGGKSTH